MNNKISLRKIILIVGLIIMNFLLVKLIIYSLPPSVSYEEDYKVYFSEYLLYTGVIFLSLFLYLNFIVKEYKERIRDILITVANLGFILIFLFNYPLLGLSGLVLTLFSMVSLVIIDLKEKAKK
ncbi:hypothetical protein [Tenacibaculum agarivorans]|uniref:hypothetical protein n=1 Tax=Tenacibaculum agarivorans TaxID=1908389 RepID=UPI00094B9555|nr:hypothetical protein [Tenacibaculum agarivorans]